MTETKEKVLNGCLTEPQRDQLLIEINAGVKGMKDDIRNLEETVYGVGEKDGLKTDVEKMKFLWPVLVGIGFVLSFFMGIYNFFKH